MHLECTLTSEALDKWHVNICWNHFETDILLKILQTDIFIDSKSLKVGSPVLSDICIQSYEYKAMAGFGTIIWARFHYDNLLYKLGKSLFLWLSTYFIRSECRFWCHLTRISCFVYRVVGKIRIKSKFKATLNYSFVRAHINNWTF